MFEAAEEPDPGELIVINEEADMKIDGGCHCGNIGWHLSLHRLPDSIGNRVSGERTGDQGKFSVDGKSQDLREDGGERRQACAGVLPRVRHADLCNGSGEPANIQHPRRYGAATGGVATKITRMVSIGARLGQ